MVSEMATAGAENVARWPELLPWQLATAREALAARATWPHALLLDGPRGIGKRTLALNLARAILCETPRADGLACGTCASCHYLAAGQHPDLQLVEPFAIDENGEVKVQDPIPVDRIRAVTDWVQLTSHRGRAKVAVIVPAESMNLAAANALLKTLEEPPPATYLMLVAHQPGRVPATLRSRCRRMAAPRPTMADAEAWLEKQGVTSPRVALAQAGGAPLAALAMSGAAWQAERSAWMQALARPEALSPVALAAWIEAAPKDERRERLGLAIDWLVAWTGTWAASPPAGFLCGTSTLPLRSTNWPRRWRGSPCFAIIGHCSGNARRSRIRCNPALSPRRSSSVIANCFARKPGLHGGSQGTPGCTERRRRTPGRLVAQHPREGSAVRGLHAVPQRWRNFHSHLAAICAG
jgi:DNA polymerase-3 subunit delta'